MKSFFFICMFEVIKTLKLNQNKSCRGTTLLRLSQCVLDLRVTLKWIFYNDTLVYGMTTIIHDD